MGDAEQLVSEVFGAFDLHVYKSNVFKMIMEKNAKNVWKYYVPKLSALSNFHYKQIMIMDLDMYDLPQL